MSKKKKRKHSNAKKKNSKQYRKEQNLKNKKQTLQNKAEVLVSTDPEKSLEQTKEIQYSANENKTENQKKEQEKLAKKESSQEKVLEKENSQEKVAEKESSQEKITEKENNQEKVVEKEISQEKVAEKEISKKKKQEKKKQQETNQIKKEPKKVVKLKSKQDTKKIKREKKSKKDKRKINTKKVLIYAISSILLVTIIALIVWYMINFVFIMKENLQLEVGTTTSVDARQFLNNYNQEGDIKLLTDLSTIDFNKINEYDIELEFNGRKYKSKLQLVDTVAPQVEFKNVNAYIDYVFNPDDFIVSKTDITEMTVEIENQPEIKEYKEYPITIIVRDQGGNETRGDVILNTSYIKSEFTLELGNTITPEDLLSNPVVDGHLLPQSELDRINSSPIGEYEIKTVNMGMEYTTKIKIQDTTAPNLVLQDVTIYDDETKLDKTAFIQSITDASEYTTELKTQIPFKQVGTYDIQIEAKDIYNNTVTQTAKLTIQKDTVGPVISGLGNLTVNKNSKVDWNKGVSARDAKDGACEVVADASSVNLGVSGTYNVTYTSKDKSGNTTKKTRKVTVSPDATDVSNKAQEWLSKSGRDPISIKNYVSNTIKYSTATNRNPTWGAWMGFTQLRGDCYVHAAVTNMLLQKAGYSCMIVNATDNGHYWNLVNVGGSWRHLDSTPPDYSKNGLMTDEQRASTLKGGRDWNRSAFPKAE